MAFWSDAVGSRQHELRIEVKPAPRIRDDSSFDLRTSNTILLRFSSSDETIAEEIVLPFGPKDVAVADEAARRLTGEIIARRLSNVPLDPLCELGRQLFDAVFAGRRKVLFDRHRESAREAGTGLRIRIVQSSNNWRDTNWLPWECLYDSRRADFLALSMLTRVVRDVGNSPVDAITLAQIPIRVLVATADLGEKMGAKEEVASLRQIAENHKGKMKLTFLESCTRREFLNKLHDQSFDIIHIIGTGVTNDQNDSGEPGIVLMPEEDLVSTTQIYAATQIVTAGELIKAVADQNSVRLVFFDACDTDGVASQLAKVAQAVIGVRGKISIEACTAFALDLYRGILRGEPLDTAVTSARQKADLELAGSREWGLQLFYLQSPDGEFAQWPRAGLATGSESRILSAGRAGSVEKAALIRAMLKRNEQFLADLIDRFGEDVPEEVRGQRQAIRSRLRRL